MKNRKLAGAGVVVSAATTITALLLGISTAAASEAHPDTAFGFSLTGLLPLGPLVTVSSPDGRPVHGELIGLGSVPGASGTGFSSGVLTSDVEAGLATTSVANLKLGSLLRADLITTTCENGKGRLEIVNGRLLGTALPQFPPAGRTLDLSPLAKATLGAETRNTDGTTTVTGITISVLIGGGLPSLPGLATGILPPLLGFSNPTTTAMNVAPVAYSVPLVVPPTADDGFPTQGPTTTSPQAPPVPTTTTPSPTPTTAPTTAPTVAPTSEPAVPGPPAKGGAVLTITIGSATCGTVAGP